MKRGTIVTGIWLLPGRRKKGATNLEEARRHMFKEYCHTDYPYPLECQYGYYGGQPSHWNFGLVCVAKIAAEAGCDLVVYTDPFSETILKHPSHHNIINAIPNTFLRNMSKEIMDAWNFATIRQFDIDSTSLISLEREIQHKYDCGNIRGNALIPREFGIPYYSPLVSEKPRIALDGAIKSESEQVYWIDTHMWYSNNNGGLSAKSIDEVLQQANGDYFNKLYNVMSERPDQMCIVSAGGLTLAGGIFGGTKSATMNALGVYASDIQAQHDEWANHLKDRELVYDANENWIGDKLCNVGTIVDTMRVHWNEQELLSRLHKDQKINLFVTVDPRMWDFHLWPALIEQTHRSGR